MLDTVACIIKTYRKEVKGPETKAIRATLNCVSAGIRPDQMLKAWLHYRGMFWEADSVISCMNMQWGTFTK